MSDTHDDLSCLPPATLRAALNASEKRVRREKEKIQSKIRKLQKRLEELEEGEETSPDRIEVKKSVAGGSRRRAKRLRADSSSDDEVVDEKYSRTKARRVGPGPVSSQRYVCSGDGTLVMTGHAVYRIQCAERDGSIENGKRTPLVGGVLLANIQSLGVI